MDLLELKDLVKNFEIAKPRLFETFQESRKRVYANQVVLKPYAVMPQQGSVWWNRVTACYIVILAR